MYWYLQIKRYQRSDAPCCRCVVWLHRASTIPTFKLVTDQNGRTNQVSPSTRLFLLLVCTLQSFLCLDIKPTCNGSSTWYTYPRIVARASLSRGVENVVGTPTDV